MSNNFKTTERFLALLVKLRKKLAIKNKFGRSGLGVLGIACADQYGIVESCILMAPGPCSPAPATFGKEIALAIYQAFKEGLRPVGLVLINPDIGGEGGAFIGGAGYEKEAIIAARMYSKQHVAHLFKGDESYQFFVLIDNEEKPMISFPLSLSKLGEFSPIGKDSFCESKGFPRILVSNKKLSTHERYIKCLLSGEDGILEHAVAELVGAEVQDAKP